MWFIKFVLIIVIASYLFPPLFRFLLKVFVTKQFGKMQDQMNQQFKNAQRPTTKEGEIKVETTKATAKKGGIDDGEYVDFEEIKD